MTHAGGSEEESTRDAPGTLRVLHVVAPARTGGLERVVVALTGGLRALAHDARVGAILDRGEPRHPFVEALRAASVPVTSWELPGRAYVRERGAVRELIRSFRPAVVHTHGARVDVLDSGVARHLGVPTVTTVHGFTGGGWKNRAYQRLQRRAFRGFDAVVAVSAPLAEGLVRDGVPADRVHLLRNAWPGRTDFLERLPARELLGLPREGLRVGWVGRLGREKGADVLLDALARIPDLRLSASFVGDGPERTDLVDRARALGILPRVAWHGEVLDAARAMKAFDVLVLSSRTEGTPIVLLEAMAAGVPIVATSVGGIPDVVSPEEAVLVAASDPSALAAAIRTVLEDPAAATARAASAVRRLSSEFAAGPWIARYASLYAALSRGRHAALGA